MKQFNHKLKYILAVALSAFVWINAFADDNENSSTDFTLEEVAIYLELGESYQLHVSPPDADVIWVGDSWLFSVDDNIDDYDEIYSLYPTVAVVDKDGLVTAFKSGATYVYAQSKDGSISKRCRVYVSGDDWTGWTSQWLGKVSECEKKDIKITFWKDGEIDVEGTFYGSGVKGNRMCDTDTKQCLFIWFETEDTNPDNFYTQPFSYKIQGLEAQEYTIYINDNAHMHGQQDKYVKYTLKRGSSIGDNANQNGNNDDFRDLTFPLKEFVEVPNKFFIKKDVDVSKSYIISMLEKQFDGNYQISRWIGDMCKVVVEDSLIDNAINEFLKDDSVLIARRVHYFKNDYEYFINHGTKLTEDMELCIFNDITYGIKRGISMNVVDSLANVFGLSNNSSANDSAWQGMLSASKTANIIEITRVLYETGYFNWIQPEFYMPVVLFGDTTPTFIEDIENNGNKELETIFFDLSGRRINTPSGLTIVVTRYSDGTIRTEKKLF